MAALEQIGQEARADESSAAENKAQEETETSDESLAPQKNEEGPSQPDSLIKEETGSKVEVDGNAEK